MDDGNQGRDGGSVLHEAPLVGYFCNTIAQHLSQIAHTWITHIVQISAASQKVDRSSVSLIQHSILPLRELIASATVQLQLMQSMGWNKIAVISTQHSNFVDSKRAFLKTAKEYGIQTETRIEVFNSPKNSC